MVNAPGVLRRWPARCRLGVRPGLEVFDTGQPVMVKVIADGLIDDPVMIQLWMGIAYGAADHPTTLLSMVNLCCRTACSRRSRSGGCSSRTWRWPPGRRQRARRAGGQPLRGPRQLATDAELVEPGRRPRRDDPGDRPREVRDQL